MIQKQKTFIINKEDLHVHSLLKEVYSFLKIKDENQVVTNAPEIHAWLLKDVTARNYIFTTLMKPMKENLYSCETAAAMWTKLETLYKAQN